MEPCLSSQGSTLGTTMAYSKKTQKQTPPKTFKHYRKLIEPKFTPGSKHASDHSTFYTFLVEWQKNVDF